MIQLKPFTEKSERLKPLRKYFFNVRDLNKIQIRQEVERLFSVKVDKVNILSHGAKRARRGRIQLIKRVRQQVAVVTLSYGHVIALPALNATSAVTANELATVSGSGGHSNE